MATRRQQFWTAAVTKVGQEMRAASHVERLGFEFFLPRLEEFDGKRFRRVFMFPNYLLIKIAPGWQRLWSTRGVSRLLMAGEEPSRVRASEVESLRALSDDRDVVHLTPRPRVGQVVVVGGGSGFAGLSGIVQGTPARDRCQVLLRIMGRDVVGEFDERFLSVA